MPGTPCPVAVIGGARLPFAHWHTTYGRVPGKDLLAAALKGLVERFGLTGELIGEVAAGSVLKHSRDFNQARECVIGSGLDPRTPAYDVQQACCTGLQATMLVANKIALGQIDVGIAGGADTMSDIPLGLDPRLSRSLVSVRLTRNPVGRLRALAGIRPWDLRPESPSDREPATGLSVHQHAALTALEWSISREQQDAFAVASHRKAAAAWDRGSFHDLVTPYLGLAGDNNLRPDTDETQLAKLAPVPGTDPAAGLTAGNVAPLSDGASFVLLASEEWAAARGLHVLAYVTGCRTAAVDHASGADGLLMAPAYAVPALLDSVGLELSDLHLVEINEAYAAQVLAMLAAWEDPKFCTERLGRDSPLGHVDPLRLNVNGGALALGHPFAATGARLVASWLRRSPRGGSEGPGEHLLRRRAGRRDDPGALSRAVPSAPDPVPRTPAVEATT